MQWALNKQESCQTLTTRMSTRQEYHTHGAKDCTVKRR